MQHHTPRPRAPVALIAAALVLALLLAAAVLSWMAWQFTLLDPTIASILRVGLFVLLYGIPAGSAIVGLIAAYNRFARIEIVKADKTIALTRAQNQKLPDSVTNLSYHDSSRPIIQPPVEDVPLLPEPTQTIPTFAQLLDKGTIGAGRPLLFGFDVRTAQPVIGSWMDLYSVGIGGLPGSGKTTAAASWVAQSALAGARIILADPHAGNPESLASRLAPLSAAFICDPAQTSKEIVAALHLCHDKLRRRAAGQGKHWPILFICDEWTSLLRTSAVAGLPDLVKNISQEGRKYGIFAILLAQNWGQDQSGHVRDELCSHLIMRTRPESGRYQTGLRASYLPDDLLQLTPGEGYLMNNKGDVTRLRIPQIEDSDLTRVGALLATSVQQPSQPIGFRPPVGITPSAVASGVASDPLPTMTAEAPGKPLGSAVAEAASTAPQSYRRISPEALRAAGLFRQKMSEKAIIKELRGIEGGRGYDAARDEVRQLIVEGLIYDHR